MMLRTCRVIFGAPKRLGESRQTSPHFREKRGSGAHFSCNSRQPERRSGKPESALSEVNKDQLQGNGLGLSISHGIIQDYGGSIHASSVEHHGACFTILFPKADMEQLPKSDD
jgi:hypothetical protein